MAQLSPVLTPPFNFPFYSHIIHPLIHWVGSEQRYRFISVDEDKLTLETASDVLRLTRIKE